MRRDVLEGWRSQQGRGADGTIESDERVTARRAVVPANEAGARELGDRYWDEVAAATLGLVRLRAASDGSELRVGPVGILRFGPAETAASEDGIVCRFPIRGGLLARRPGGALVLSQSGATQPELRAAVTGFVPRLGLRRHSPYDLLQRRAHVAVSRRFFRRLLHEAAT